MTTASDLIASCEVDGILDNWAGLGAGRSPKTLEWVSKGVCVPCDMYSDYNVLFPMTEHPARSYELLSGVQASWLKEKTVNYFLLKKTLLLEPRGRSLCSDLSLVEFYRIPAGYSLISSSNSEWVEWESRRGKWSKRWRHLKENAIYLSKDRCG